jgi:hypothetical protein
MKKTALSCFYHPLKNCLLTLQKEKKPGDVPYSVTVGTTIVKFNGKQYLVRLPFSPERS